MSGEWCVPVGHVVAILTPLAAAAAYQTRALAVANREIAEANLRLAEAARDEAARARERIEALESRGSER